MGSSLSFLIALRAPTSKIGIHVAPSPAIVHVKDATPLTLLSFIETRCHSLFKGFTPAWWLFNGHIQTFYAVMGDFSKIDKVVYERRLLRVPDGGTLGLDFTPHPEDNDLDPETPVVVVMHGLTGGSYESYVRSVLSVACAPKTRGGLGYRGVVVNFRGFILGAGVEITSTQFYSGGHTDDLRIALLYISQLYPRAKLMGVGFSLGANVITRYLGEEGKASKLISGCALGCPWDFVKNSDELESGWISRMVYSRGMANNLRRLVERHLPSLARLGPSDVTPHLEHLLSTEKAKTLIQVDEHFTRFVGGSSPPFPFPSAREYYVWASSHNHIKDIRVPYLAINAIDDPVVKKLPLPLPEEASCVVIAVTQHGGHLGWFQRNKEVGQWHVERWVRQPICEWLRAIAEDLVTEIKEGGSVELVDGFTRQVGNPNLGYRELGAERVVADTSTTRGILAGL